MYTNEYRTETPTWPFRDLDVEMITRGFAAELVAADDEAEDEDEDEDEDDDDEDDEKDSDDDEEEDEEEDEEDDDDEDPDTLKVGTKDMTLAPKPGTPGAPPENINRPKPQGRPADAPSNPGDDHMGATEDQVTNIPAPSGKPFKDEPKQG